LALAERFGIHSAVVVVAVVVVAVVVVAIVAVEKTVRKALYMAVVCDEIAG
jgi:hypothetical protein